MPAWAKHFGKSPLRLVFFSRANYASGTKNPNGHDWNTFDELYPSNHDKLGLPMRLVAGT